MIEQALMATTCSICFWAGQWSVVSGQ